MQSNDTCEGKNGIIQWDTRLPASERQGNIFFRIFRIEMGLGLPSKYVSPRSVRRTYAGESAASAAFASAIATVAGSATGKRMVNVVPAPAADANSMAPP